MKSKAFWRMTYATMVLVLAADIGAVAQNPTQLSGVIDAYSPQTTTSSGTTGPYEVHGPWSMQLVAASTNVAPGRANFTAALNMELSDGWVLTVNGGNFDPNARGAHTHHVTLTSATVTWMTNGFQVSGIATVTLNGNPAPVSPTPLVITVTGGSNVEYSNISLLFGTPGSKHFGTEPLPGVVQSAK